MAMTIFQLDSATVAARTDSLRADAANLHPLHDVAVPDAWPLGDFRAAVSHAIAKANADADALRGEARRIAAAMDLAVEAAASVEASTCQRLGATL